jgi:hypothetical protein
MRFELMHPWTAWKIKTVVGENMFDAKVDSGASLTLVGIDNARELGVDLSFTSKQPCVRYSGVSEKADGYAFRVPCGSIPLGGERLRCDFIHIPFEYAVDKAGRKLKYRFVTPNKYLVGTDVLNNYSVSVRFKGSLFGDSVKSVKLKLKEHGLSLPMPPVGKGYTFSQLAPKLDEVDEIVFELLESP